ncbi:hypothetical protein NDU88_009001 [Pleurodeles waltl]|uniref:Uncharacterized protein n=1 Tax=Pleurodeles waltl TaxID=8319 RepID=A0AAV7N8Y7_PLEWA|nr:hypothetical protein NDU88_009001 [Pleurodeles waltl]
MPSATRPSDQGPGDSGIVIETSVPQTKRTPAECHKALSSVCGGRWIAHRNQCTPDQVHPCLRHEASSVQGSGDRGVLLETSAPQTRRTTDQRHEASSAQGLGDRGVLLETSAPQTRPSPAQRHEAFSAQGPRDRGILIETSAHQTRRTPAQHHKVLG